MRPAFRLALFCAPLSLAPACEKASSDASADPGAGGHADTGEGAPSPGPVAVETTKGAGSEAGPQIVVPTHDEREVETGSETTPETGLETAPEAAPEPEKPEAKAELKLPAPMFPNVREGCGGAPGVGQKVKGFKLKSTSGKTIAPSYYRGRVVLLNFWGTWCKPCLKELPEFSRLYRRYRKYGLTLVAVATDDDVEAVDALIKDKKISAKVAVGGEATAGAYGDRNFPFTFVVDEKGVIRAAYDGYKEGCLGAIERDIRTQLEKRNK